MPLLDVIHVNTDGADPDSGETRPHVQQTGEWKGGWLAESAVGLTNILISEELDYYNTVLRICPCPAGMRLPMICMILGEGGMGPLKSSVA